MTYNGQNLQVNIFLTSQLVEPQLKDCSRDGLQMIGVVGDCTSFIMMAYCENNIFFIASQT